MNKRGQFFLIAALVIVAILAGLGVVYTSVNTPKEDKSVYDLSQEINTEASQVIDNGVFSASSSATINGNIDNLTSTYASAYPNSNFVFVYGDASLLHIIYYNNTNAGNIGISTGTGSKSSLTVESRNKLTQDLDNPGDHVIITLGNGINYDYNVTQGQNFYLVIKKDVQNDQIIANQ